MFKILGACLILFSCGGTGFKLASSYLKEERILKRLINTLDFMECELQYHLTPLPELCTMAAAEESGILSSVFLHFAKELEDQVTPSVNQCMESVLKKTNNLPQLTFEALQMLGQSLGRFDLPGQLKGLEGVRRECRKNLDMLYKEKNERTRRYQTLGICAGAALIILFI